MIDFLDYFQFEFVQNAYLSSVFLALICGMIGTLVVVNRMVFASEGIAHSAFSGIGLGIFYGFSPYLGAVISCIVNGSVIGILSLGRNTRKDTVIGVVMALNMALGMLFINLTPGYKSDPLTYLFGSIIAISSKDLIYMGVFSVVIFCLMIKYHRIVISVSYDPVFARTKGIPADSIRILMLIIISVSVILVIKSIGLILFIALLAIPPFIMEKYSGSLTGMMVYSSLLSFVVILAGLTLSILLDVSSGSLIVVVAGIVYFAELCVRLSLSKIR